MPLQILPVQAEDIHKMALLRLDALEQSPTLSPFWQQLRGKRSPALLASQEQALRSDFIASTAAANRTYLKVVDNNGPDTEIVSYCQWHGPAGEEWEIIQGAQKVSAVVDEVAPGKEKPVETNAKSATLAMVEGANVEALTAINAEEVAMNERMWRKDNVRCFRLTNLMTYPKHQRRGAASLLIKHGLALADASHLPTVLQADPDGYNIYKRFGFEDFGVWQVDLVKFGGQGIVYNTGMVRKAR